MNVRDDAWLGERVRLLREQHFADVAQGYPITARFAARAKNRLGSISARNGQTLITANRLFALPDVPVYVVDATMGHELAHYAHGYGSGLPLRHANPHRGGVVDAEMDARGLRDVRLRAEQWREAHWSALYDLHCGDIRERKAARQEARTDEWDTFLCQPKMRSSDDLNRRLQAFAPLLGYPVAPPFAVGWLRATRRQTGQSYYFDREQTVRLHGLLADCRVPNALVDFQILYWLARQQVGSNWGKIEHTIQLAGLAHVTRQALDWRKRRWDGFVAKNHPLAT